MARKPSKKAQRSWITVSGIGLVVTIGSLYYGYSDPDLRLSYSQDSNAGLQIHENHVDSGTTFLGSDSTVTTLISFQVAITNRSVKPGAVKDIELVPIDSIGEFISAKVTAVDRVPIYWHRTEKINIRAEILSRGRFKITSVIPPKTPGEDTTMKAEQQHSVVDLEVRMSDDRGHSITRYEDDQWKSGRMRLHLVADPPIRR